MGQQTTLEEPEVGGLTAKQIEVLDLLIEHKTSKEIARALDISPYTVDQRINFAKDKLGVRTRGEAAVAYRVCLRHANNPHTEIRVSHPNRDWPNRGQGRKVRFRSRHDLRQFDWTVSGLRKRISGWSRNRSMDHTAPWCGLGRSSWSLSASSWSCWEDWRSTANSPRCSQGRLLDGAAFSEKPS